jgi:hypothetical protein
MDQPNMTQREFPSVYTETPMQAEVVRTETAQMLRDLIGKVEPGTSLKAIWRTLSIRLRLTVGQIKRLWYAEMLIIPAHIYLTVRAAWDRLSELALRLEKQIDAQATAYQERRQKVERRGV